MFVEAVCRKFFYPKWEFFWFFCVGNGEKLLLFSFPGATIVLCKRVKANLRGRRHEGYSCEEESLTYMSSLFQQNRNDSRKTKIEMTVYGFSVHRRQSVQS